MKKISLYYRANFSSMVTKTENGKKENPPVFWGEINIMYLMVVLFSVAA